MAAVVVALAMLQFFQVILVVLEAVEDLMCVHLEEQEILLQQVLLKVQMEELLVHLQIEPRAVVLVQQLVLQLLQ